MMVMCKFNSDYEHIYQAVCCLFLFGAPHRGLGTAELEAMIEDLEGGKSVKKREILRQLEEDSTFLDEHGENLSSMWGHWKGRVFSFQEEVKSHTVEKV